MFHTLAAVKNDSGLGSNEPELRIESEKDLVQKCDRIIAVTSREKNELIRYYGAPHQSITIIPCGVNLDMFKPANKDKARQKLGLDHQRLLLYVGRLEPLKGLDKLLIALSRIENSKNLKLLVIGGDQESLERMEELHKLSADLNIRHSVDFLGSVDQSKLPSFYNAADVTVVPSYYESFSLVALESLACGTPVITTNVGDLMNIIQGPETGYVVKDNSPEELASAISRLLLQKTGKNIDPIQIRNLAASYGWSTITDKLLQEYTEVLKKNS